MKNSFDKGTAHALTSFIDPTVAWKDLVWLKSVTKLPIVLKGIQTAEDAVQAFHAGVAGIVVSNHGGRQLDGALSSIKALPGIVEAVGDKIEVHMDGGIRSGQDVLKALALGAKGTYIGRSHIYGLGAMGQEGVRKSLELIHKELDISMALCGHKRVQDLNRNTLLIPKGFAGDWE